MIYRNDSYDQTLKLHQETFKIQCPQSSIDTKKRKKRRKRCPKTPLETLNNFLSTGQMLTLKSTSYVELVVLTFHQETFAFYLVLH